MAYRSTFSPNLLAAGAGSLRGNSPLKALREQKKENTLLRLRGAQALSYETDAALKIQKGKKQGQILEAYGRVDRAKYGTDHEYRFALAGELQPIAPLEAGKLRAKAKKDQADMLEQERKTQKHAVGMLEGMGRAYHETGAFNPDAMSVLEETATQAGLKSLFDPNNLEPLFSAVSKPSASNYKTRDVPGPGRTVQKEESYDGGRTWAPLGTAYARDKPASASGSTSEYERGKARLDAGEQLDEMDMNRLKLLAGTVARPSTSPYSPQDIEGRGGRFNKMTGEYDISGDARKTGPQVRSEAGNELTRSGQELTKKGQQISKEKMAVAAANKKRDETRFMYDDAFKGGEHLRKMSRSIDESVAALDSGDTSVSDILLNQVMSQVQDTDVRAFQMYKVFDSQFGDVATRVLSSISQFLTGARTDEQKRTIRDTLVRFRDIYTNPAQSKMRNFYRARARESDLDPWKVMPPKSKEDIRDAPNTTREQKLKLLEQYFPGEF